MLHYKNSVKSQGEGWMLLQSAIYFFACVWLLFPVWMFSQRALILTRLKDEPAPDDTVGEGRSQEHWPCIILCIISNSQSAHWLPRWSHELKKDKTENLLSYFVTRSHPLWVFFSCFIIVFLQLFVSPGTSQQTVSAVTALQRSAS